MRRGFTLVELLVVLVIILVVSAVALPTVLTAMQHRQMSEAARILQAALAGARDSAIRDNAPSGIRLLPDPAWPIVRLADGSIDSSQPLACSSMVPLSRPPMYEEGRVSVYPTASYTAAVQGNTLALVLEEQLFDPDTGLVNQPTSWYWNVRVGDRLQVAGTAWYTVVGPLAIGASAGNPDMFVNVGAPGTTSPLARGKLNPEFLLLVDGKDDNFNGWVDEGWDGVDNNSNGLTDEPLEWEQEAWIGAVATNQVPIGIKWVLDTKGHLHPVQLEEYQTLNLPYVIRRRPAPVLNARVTTLPSQVVIDLTTWGTTRERSRLQVDRYTGFVDLVVNPDGSVVPQTLYASPASVSLTGAFAHFWLAERADIAVPGGTVAPSLPAPKGDNRLVTLFARSGQIMTTEQPSVAADPFAWAQRGGQ